MGKFLNKLLITVLPLTTGIVAGTSVYFSSKELTKTSSSSINQSIENDNITDSGIVSNYKKWIDEGLTTTAESYVELANNLVEKYNEQCSIDTNTSNDKFYLFSIPALDNENKSNIIKTGLIASNTTIMDNCRLVIQKLFILAQAFKNTNDQKYLTVYSEVLDAFVEKYYKYGDTEIGNWWNYEIGIPKDLLKSLAYVYTNFEKTQVDKWIKPVKWFKSTAAYKFNVTGIGTEPMKGANLIDGAYAVILYSAIQENNEKINETIELLLNDIFAFWKKDGVGDNRNGFYQDGSYVDHSDTNTKTGGLAYFGGYGIELVKGLLDIKKMVDNTKYDLNNYSLFEKFYQIIEINVMPYMYQLSLTDTLAGRSISRLNHDEKTNGKTLIHSLIYFVDDAPTNYKSRLINFILEQMDWDVPSQYMTDLMQKFKKTYSYVKDEVRYVSNSWIETNHFNRWSNNDSSNLMPIGIDLYKANNNMLYSKNQDRYSFKTNDFMFNLSFNSSRNYHFECMNGENTFGYYQGDGMTLINNNGVNNYGNNYWTTVDPFKLPGTSAIYECDTTQLTAEQIKQNTEKAEGLDKKLNSEFGNGIFVDGCGIVSGRIKNFNSTLTTDKAYLMLDGMILVIGNTKKYSEQTKETIAFAESEITDVTTSTNKPIYTTIANDMTNERAVKTTVNNYSKYTSLSNAYYILSNDDNVKSNSVSRTVDPETVNSKRTTEENMTGTFNEIYFDNTSNGYFAYVIVPEEKNQSESLQKINNIKIVNDGKDETGFTIEYKKGNYVYSFISTFTENKQVSTNNLTLTFTKPTSCIIRRNINTNECSTIFSSNVNNDDNSVSISEKIYNFNTRTIGNQNEITYSNNSFSINNNLYWDSDILHNTWATFKI